MARKSGNVNANGKKHATPQSVNSIVKSACDILRRSNCAGAMQYVPELSWLLFLRVLDEREEQEQMEAEAVEREFESSLKSPYRWRDWAAPEGEKRKELQEGTLGGVKAFVNNELLPHMRGLKEKPAATARQKIISEIVAGVERVRVDTDKNFLDVLDKVDEIKQGEIDPTHVFPLSQVYEGLLLKMGEKGNDGGQFFTPREVIRAIVQILKPRIGETVYDPCCGTGGFLAQAFEFMRAALGDEATPDQIEILAQRTFYGREKENLIFPIALANLVLHGVDSPILWHGNTLTGMETYGGLYDGAPETFDVILTNPPFGGKEGKEAQNNYAYKTNATQVLFLQTVINALKNGSAEKEGGRSGIVLDEGVLFKTNETAIVQTKRKLLDDCDLWCIVSLPAGVFSTAGAGVKTNLLFFTKGRPTERIWYYDLAHIKVTKTAPMSLTHFTELFALLPTRRDSEHSWTVDFAARRAVARKQAAPLRERAKVLEERTEELRQWVKELKRVPSPDKQQIVRIEGEARTCDQEARELAAQAQDIEDAIYDLKAVNPNAKGEDEMPTPEQLLDIIAAKGREVDDALAALRKTLVGIK